MWASSTFFDDNQNPRCGFGHRVHTEWQRPLSGVHSIMMEKLSQAGEGGGGGARPPPFTIFTITNKIAVYAPAERADTLHLFHLYLYSESTIGRCTLGCSDFDFLFTFWGITTHPWHPKGPRIWKVAKKIFKLHPWPAESFGKNRKMRFLAWFQSLILGPRLTDLYHFFSIFYFWDPYYTYQILGL
jgi:hypothetical protein